jgi:hypothetical protein
MFDLRKLLGMDHPQQHPALPMHQQAKPMHSQSYLNQNPSLGVRPIGGVMAQRGAMPQQYNPQQTDMATQGVQNPGFIPLQNSGFGGPGYGANLQPTGWRGVQAQNSYLNLQ